MAQQEIRIPDIGDAEDVEVVEILVAPNAAVAIDDPLIVIESDKASMEVPATAAGKLTQIKVAVGDKVREGQVIAVVESADASIAANAAPPEKAATAAAAPAAEAASPAANEARATSTPPSDAAPKLARTAPDHRDGAPVRKVEVRIPDIGDAKDVTVVEVAAKVGQTVAVDDLLVVLESDKASMEVPAPVAGRLVSVDVAEGTPVQEGTLLAVIETRADAGATQPTAKSASAEKSDSVAPERVAPGPAPSAATAAEVSTGRVVPGLAADLQAPSVVPVSSAPLDTAVYAGPAVRRMARELGVDLTSVKGTGAGGRVLKSDVETFVKSALAAPRRPATEMGIPPVPQIDFSRFGEIETVDLSRVRLRGAENLHRSWLNIPHVTQHDEADVTDLESFREELKSEAQSKGIKLTPLAFIVKAVVATLREFATFNASLDPTVRRMILKRYYHIGLAVDTSEGLVVPVLKDADKRGIFELAKEIETLSQKAQEKKLGLGDTQGASFTISSLGAIGGTAFTPIINSPEVAILGVSRLSTKPQWTGSTFEPRKMLPMSLSYDHRAINGAEAGRFMTSLCRTLADMRRVLL